MNLSTNLSVVDTQPQRPAALSASLDEADAVLRGASDPHPPATAAVNRRQRFNAQHQAEALDTWLRQLCETEPALDPIEILTALTRRLPKEVAAWTVLAQYQRKQGRRTEAVNAITRALAVRAKDLYAQRIYSAISHWAGTSKSNPEDTEAYLSTRHCPKPFEYFEISATGDVHVCCPSYLPVPIGNINESTAETIWESDIAVELRRSITDGSFRYCSRIHCGVIANRKLSPRQEQPAAAVTDTAHAAPPPKTVNLSHDRSCNLSCPSCRTEHYVAKKDEQDRLNRQLNESIMPILRQAEIVNITGSGDPFGSNHFRAVLRRINRRDYPKLRIDLKTNGMLWDERAWNELELSGLVRQAAISIDAARPDTYAIVRRGGDLARLRQNLAFIAKLRKAREITRLKLLFVVQALNFREMPDFVRLGEEFAADRIVFHMIRRWQSYSDKEFATHFIGSAAHPDHQEFLEVLQAPELARPNVELGNMRGYS
jgi:MoaA/NifB/PqqE/SkfB family radical SAM enzyme